MAERVKLVPWGVITDPYAPVQWGLKVGKAYVCRGSEVVLFADKGVAQAEARALRAQLSAALVQGGEANG